MELDGIFNRVFDSTHNALRVQSASSVPNAAGAQAWAPVGHKLKRDQSNVSVVVLGDSTGADQPGAAPPYNRWAGQWAAALAPLWPTKTVNYRTWDGTAALYDTGSTALQTLQTGSGVGNSGGPFLIDVYNGSIPGTILHSPLGVNVGLLTTLSAAITTAGQTAITVTANPWNAGAVQFTIQIDFEQMLVTAGQGTTSLTVTRGVNGTTAVTHLNGANVTLAPRWLQMVQEIQPDLVFVSYGHNEYDPTAKPGEMENRLFMLVEHLRLDCPDTQVIIIGQNPRIATTVPYASNGLQELRIQEAERFAAMRGYGFIDISQVFADAGTPPTWYTNTAGVPTDGVHPNATGSAAWAAEVLRHTLYTADIQPRPSPPSVFGDHEQGVLVGANMQEFGANGFIAWTKTNVTVAKGLQNGQNIETGATISLTSTGANALSYISQGLGNLPAFKGKWLSALARVFVAVGSTANVGIVGLDDGVTATTNGSASQEGQGMWRYVVVRKRTALTGTLMTTFLYADSSTSDAAGSLVFVDFCNTVIGSIPHPPPVRTPTTVWSDLKMFNSGKWRGQEGSSNSTQGVATLVGGTVTVSTTKVLTGDRIRLTGQSSGAGVGTWGELAVTTLTTGTSFVITSSSATDTRTVLWEVVGVY